MTIGFRPFAACVCARVLVARDGGGVPKPGYWNSTLTNTSLVVSV